MVVDLPPTAATVYSIYGTDEAVATIPGGYQTPAPFGANTGGVNPQFFAFMPLSQYDSWLTVGLTSGDPSGSLSSIGIDFDSWQPGSTLRITDGAVFYMDPSSVVPASSYVIAQITVPRNGPAWTMKISLQGDSADPTQPDWHEEGVRFVSSTAPPCPSTFLGPEMGYQNLMTFNDDTGNCEISMVELQRICTGAMFQTCMNMLQSG
jgi:hypothetical protein